MYTQREVVLGCYECKQTKYYYTTTAYIVYLILSNCQRVSNMLSLNDLSDTKILQTTRLHRSAEAEPSQLTADYLTRPMV